KQHKKIINTDKLKHPEEKEIISATKIAMYTQCPLKYALTYEFGFNKVNNLLSGKNPQLKNTIKIMEPSIQTEDEEISLSNVEADLKGTLIHWLLEHDIGSENYRIMIRDYLVKHGYDDKFAYSYADELIPELTNYFNTDIYKYISSQKEYKNEFEIYCRDQNSYLFGIVDKLIKGENNITILDYKTDDIKEHDIEKRADNYFIQLEFYLYLVTNLFADHKVFELILIFIKHPDRPVIKKYNIDEISLVKTKISDIIKGIIQKEFYKQTDHCVMCNFSDHNNNCIMTSESEWLFK